MNPRFLNVATAIAGACFFCTPAMAKDDWSAVRAIEMMSSDRKVVGFTIPSKPERRLDQDLDKFGLCIAQNRKLNVQKMYSAEPVAYFNGFDNFGETPNRQEFEKCLGGTTIIEATGPFDLFVGRIAHGLYVSKFPSLPTLYLGELSKKRSDPIDPGYVNFFNFADCLVRKNAVASDRFVREKPGSVAAFNAFSSLSPHFLGCLGESRGLMSTPLFIRGAMGLALYRRATDSSNGGLSSAGIPHISPAMKVVG